MSLQYIASQCVIAFCFYDVRDVIENAELVTGVPNKSINKPQRVLTITKRKQIQDGGQRNNNVASKCNLPLKIIHKKIKLILFVIGGQYLKSNNATLHFT